MTQSSRKTDWKIERDKKKVSEFWNLELKNLITRMDNTMIKLKINT